MITVRRLPEFDGWLNRPRDRETRIRLARRLDKIQRGNLGDIKSVGDGMFEMRELFGPGWRMYFVQQGTVVVVMQGGGDKTSQARDIAAAQKLATALVFQDSNGQE